MQDSAEQSNSLPETGMDSNSKLNMLEEVVATGLTFPGLARLLVEWTLAWLPARSCSLSLKDPCRMTSLFEGISSEGDVKVSEVLIPEKVEDGSPDTGGQIISLSSEMSDSTFSKDKASLGTEIAHGSQVLGHITLVADPGHEFTQHDQQTLAKLAGQFGFLLHHRSVMEKAQDLAVRDQLTGLHNRRHLWQSLEKWIPKARNEQRMVSLFMLDVDHFKSFNDTWGHAVGDRVLQLLGNLIQSTFRSDDAICRYGGEEFAVLLCDHRPGSVQGPAEAFQFAERLRRAAEKLNLTSEDGQALSQITISGGLATFPTDAETAEALVEKADQALYQAKRNGRNQICLAGRTDSSKAG